MDQTRIAGAERLRSLANRLCFICVGAAYFCFLLVAWMGHAQQLYLMSIGWGLIAGASFAIATVLVATLRISRLERKMHTAPSDARLSVVPLEGAKPLKDRASDTANPLDPAAAHHAHPPTAHSVRFS